MENDSFANNLPIASVLLCAHVSQAAQVWIHLLEDILCEIQAKHKAAMMIMTISSSCGALLVWHPLGVLCPAHRKDEGANKSLLPRCHDNHLVDCHDFIREST